MLVVLAVHIRRHRYGPPPKPRRLPSGKLGVPRLPQVARVSLGRAGWVAARRNVPASIWTLKGVVLQLLRPKLSPHPTVPMHHIMPAAVICAKSGSTRKLAY